MALLKELKIQSVVILAKNFNPTIFNQFWLVNSGFFSEKEILPNSLFTPAFAQIFSTKCNLLILPEQLQFNSVNPSETEENLRSCLIPMLNKLKETPYTAVGINFNWYINDDSGKTICELSKELFFRNGSEMYSRFNVDDARFGIYLSKDIEGLRLKLDIKPIKLSEINSNETTEYIQCVFNFHSDLDPNSSYQDLITCLEKWSVLRKESEIMTNLL